MKKTKFATNPVAKKIKKEAKQRRDEAILNDGDFELPNFYEPKQREVPNVFLLGVLVGAALPLIHFFVVMPLLTNL